MSADCIDLIIPVHRGLDSVRVCLDSMYSAAQRQAFEVLLVNDASPEPGMHALLKAYAERPHTLLLEQETNLGFVESVNRAAACHPERNFLILNSDTRVSGDWLDRMVRCARHDTRIATVTPFSNNATLCSYPLPMIGNPLPTGLDLAELDTLFKTVNADRYTDIPTGVGFCMYIDRTAWQTLGGFDAQRFGRGYGEENDFCRRLAASDWRNVVCADVFVFHEGAVSFGAERHALQKQAYANLIEVHPDYEALIQSFIASDPLRPFRLAIDRARARLDTDQALQVLAEHEQARELEMGGLRAAHENHVHSLKSDIEKYAAALARADDFVRTRERELADMGTEREQLHAERARLRDQLHQQIGLTEALQRELEIIYASRTWRYTRFLRKT